MDRSGDLRHMYLDHNDAHDVGMLTSILYLHIAGGSAALLSMFIPLVTRKGGLTHRRAGWVFVSGNDHRLDHRASAGRGQVGDRSHAAGA